MNNPDFDWEFYAGEETQVPDRIRDEAYERLVALAAGHDDMIGASVALERPAHRETAFVYECRVIAFVRPKNLVANEKSDSIEGALNGAINAIERQLRQKRERLGKPWQEPSKGVDLDELESNRS